MNETLEAGLRLPPAAADLINGPVLGHLVTVNPDGSPHVTGVWVGLDGDEIVFASMYAWRKTKNVLRDPRVALSVEGRELHESGLREYLVVRGTVTVTPSGAFAVLRELAQTYIGPGADFPPEELAVRSGYVMRIRIDSIGGIGPWTAGPPGLPAKSDQQGAQS